MKIALVYPPCGETNLKGGYPLGIAYLSAYLKQSHEVDIYNYNGQEDKASIKAFFSAVKTTQPDMVAISFNSFNRGQAYTILKKIKKINKNIIVVLGGVHPSTTHQQLFKYFYKKIDFIIQSEGEMPLQKLCHALKNNEDYSNISGLVYKDGKGGIFANPVTEIIQNLDEMLLPDYSYVADEIKKWGLAYLITSRGCPANCTFCSTSSFWGQKVRLLSPERVGQEVEYVKSLGARRLLFHDDTFNLGISRTLKIAEILKKFDIEYAVSCRVKPVTDEMIGKLVESGCRHIAFGVETLADATMTQINKNISKEDVKHAFDICANYTDKLTTSAFCCVGLPGESDETIDETVEYLNKNIRSTHGPSASMLYILPGTQVHDNLVKEGRFKESTWVKSNSVYYTPEYPIKTLNRWRKKINRSGIRIPFTAQPFWDDVVETKKEDESIWKKTINKWRKKIKRNINLFYRRY